MSNTVGLSINDFMLLDIGDTLKVIKAINYIKVGRILTVDNIFIPDTKIGVRFQQNNNNYVVLNRSWFGHIELYKKHLIKSPRYLLFAGENYEARGGIQDLITFSNDEKLIKQKTGEVIRNTYPSEKLDGLKVQWAHILDVHEMKIIYSIGYTDKFDI